ncbi:MAG TPA: universal stress protein [Chitinophaga sp.]|uniref:universal stress protein n=1 Tax=Chitinophaga sp. TaxID=1869181 RepID=UPI002DB5D116|nr:universal stress protein [Chitinophaga sp.]HEU4555697.1 universal stress protein [Chitinophaga sp.]
MQKMLYVTDALQFNRQCFDFACALSNITGAMLTGIFLENPQLEQRAWETIQETAFSVSVADTVAREIRKGYCEENIRYFKETCNLKGITCSVHRHGGAPIQEAIKESRYADVIVVDPAISFSEVRETAPSAFLKELLKQAECPVIIAPEAFDDIQEIIFTCDNTRSAVYAIKQFTYIFPQLHYRKATLLHVAEPGKTLGESKYRLKEWLKAHYDNVEILVLEDANVKARLLEHLLARRNAFVVMGAYGRSTLSNLLWPSHAAPVVKLVTLPVFIAHP